MGFSPGAMWLWFKWVKIGVGGDVVVKKWMRYVRVALIVCGVCTYLFVAEQSLMVLEFHFDKGKTER